MTMKKKLTKGRKAKKGGRVVKKKATKKSINLMGLYGQELLILNRLLIILTNLFKQKQ